jgi:histidyl-tRNA synthetase
MSGGFQVPRGTFDVTPEDTARRAQVLETASRLLGAAGYGRIETPVFEDTELFARGVGQATEIVRKEMFTFEDLGGRSITLRPEGTAPICRAYVEHGMKKLPQPVKLWYSGPFFRYEAPQAGRHRQFVQIGAEVIGSDSPLLDAEAILLLWDLLAELGIEGVELRLGSLGSPAGRTAYREELTRYLEQYRDALAKDVQDRIAENPLRAFDSDHEGTRQVMAEAPTMLDRLDVEDAEHFAVVRRLLDQNGVEYRLDGTLVRGLDYYTRTVFEFTCDRLGAQSGIGGGGRYDGLVEQLGGPPTPAVGWAAGIERILIALGTSEVQTESDAFVVAEEGERERALAIVTSLRRAGLSADLDLAGRSRKGQMKQADRRGARYTVLLDAEEPTLLRDMATGDQRSVDDEALAEELQPPTT